MPTIGRLLKIIGLFCKRALQKRLYSSNETYNFQEPTNRSHPICGWEVVCECVVPSFGKEDAEDEMSVGERVCDDQVCCSVLWCVAVCCSVLQCVAVCDSVSPKVC